MLSVVGSCVANAAEVVVNTEVTITKSGLVEKTSNGDIDWGKEMFYATGEGAVPSESEEPNRAIAFLKAKDYAKMDAIASMQMLIQGTSISYEATGQDYMVKDSTLRQKIEGYIKNVSVLKTEQVGKGEEKIVRVTVVCKMYGADSPGNALLQKMSELALMPSPETPEPTPVKVEIPKEAPKPVEPMVSAPEPVVTPPPPVVTTPKPIVVKPPKPKPLLKPHVPKHIPKVAPKPVPSQPTLIGSKPPDVGPPVAATTAATSVTADAGGSYTSVVIDTLGFNVRRAMSPKIRTSEGDEVWGTLKISPDEVQDQGPVAYARTLEDAKKCSRAGSSPLLLRAVGRAGGSRMCDVVLSDEDVTKLRAADQAAQPPFLPQMRVVMVVDPLKAF
jgi:hypothetical protein